MKTTKFDKHSECRISAVAGLFSNSKRCCDLEMAVGTTVFRFRKLVLSLKSFYFEQMLYPENHQAALHRLMLEDIRPENFKNVLHYMYMGEIELNPDVVSEIILMAELFDICDLKQLCLQFARDTLDIDNCITYWKLAEEFAECHPAGKCYELSISEIVRGAKSIDLQDVTEVMLKMAMEQDGLNVNSEMDVCEVILRWCDENKSREEPMHPYELLQCIRWLGVDFEYVKWHIIINDVLTKDRECAEYLFKVTLYKLCGIEFDGLLTFHRPSSGFERCAIIVGLNTSDGLKSDCFRVSLQQRQTVGYISRLPTVFQCESIACSNNTAMYVTGIGMQELAGDVEMGFSR